MTRRGAECMLAEMTCETRQTLSPDTDNAVVGSWMNA